MADYINIRDIKPHPENPKEHPDAQLEYIAYVIENYGWGRAILISKDNFILAGHGAVMAAEQKLGMNRVPYTRSEHLHNTPEAIALMLADNKLGELSLWIESKLQLNAEKLELNNIDIAPLGFKMEELSLKKDPMGELTKRYNENNTGKAGSLQEDFIIPPFSVFDTRQSYWKEKKAEWKTIFDNKGQSREDLMGTQFGVSILDPVLVQVLMTWFCPEKGQILDLFAGDFTTGIISHLLGHDLEGIEIRPEQVKINNETIEKLGINAHYICDDAQNVDKHITSNSKDLLFSCPPYFDLEVYSDLPNDASNQATYKDFINIMENSLSKAIKTLKSNRFAALVVSDIRDKAGFYYGFPDAVKKIFKDNGMELYNDIVLINEAGSAPLRARQTFKFRKVVKSHQNILIFYKGDIKKIKEDFKPFGNSNKDMPEEEED
jgi:DNA modification methylase